MLVNVRLAVKILWTNLLIIVTEVVIVGSFCLTACTSSPQLGLGNEQQLLLCLLPCASNPLPIGSVRVPERM
jgi:hypothetical protein